MTMTKSITKNELINFNIEKIKRFTDVEMCKLVTNKTPFCYQVSADTVIVGRNKVDRITNSCWRVYEYDKDFYDFFSRKDAIFYCIAAHQKNYKLADSIKNNDGLLGRLEFDARMYRYGYKQAKEQEDYWLVDLYSNRYSEIVLRIELAKKELKKTINSTKYNKLYQN